MLVLQRSASLSATRKPRLCLVSLYLSPGFPSPATQNIGGRTVYRGEPAAYSAAFLSFSSFAGAAAPSAGAAPSTVGATSATGAASTAGGTTVTIVKLSLK